MSRIRTLLVAAVLFSVFSGTAYGASGVELVLPTVDAPSGLSKAQIHRAVYEALVMRGWKVTESNAEKQYVDAELSVRVHIARVRVDFSGSSIAIQHREGVELPLTWRVPVVQTVSSTTGAPQWQLVDKKPESGEAQAMVHPRYNEWLQELSVTLEGTLGLAKL